MQPTIDEILAELRNASDPYWLGYDCGLNGANTTNCHFTLFSSPERSEAWAQGKRAGEAKRKRMENIQ